eukprot:Em0006g1216a
MTDESGTFQSGDGEAYRDGTPSPKRSRYDSSGDIDSSEEGSVHLSMPQTQFEIEINSHHDTGSPTQDIEAHDLAGPTFAVIEEQDIQQLENTTASNSSQLQSTALSAINRALLQMKQPTQSSLILSSITSCSVQQPPPSSNSPLYVMIPQPSSGTDMIHSTQSQARPIAPKLQSGDDLVRQDRDQIRKATHNEVERRRRDRINELIKTLAQLVPGCQKKDASTGSIIGYVYSKGTVLDKTVDYLKELLILNEQLTHSAKLAEKSAGTISVLQSQVAALEKDNSALRSQLMQFGLDINNQPTTGPRSVPLAQALLQQCSPQATYIPAASAGNQMSTQQLLASLAQNLASSNSSLLSSVAQQVQLPTSSMLSMPQQLSSSQLTPTPPNASPQIPQLGALHGVQNTSVNQSVPLINLLVQTLASFANPAPVQATSLPRIAVPQFHPQLANQSNLSAAAAATLLNTILVANMLGGGRLLEDTCHQFDMQLAYTYQEESSSSSSFTKYTEELHKKQVAKAKLAEAQDSLAVTYVVVAYGEDSPVTEILIRHALDRRQSVEKMLRTTKVTSKEFALHDGPFVKGLDEALQSFKVVQQQQQQQQQYFGSMFVGNHIHKTLQVRII